MKKVMNTVKTILERITETLLALAEWFLCIALPIIFGAIMFEVAFIALYAPSDIQHLNVAKTGMMDLINESFPAKEVLIEILTTTRMLIVFFLVIYIVMVFVRSLYKITIENIILAMEDMYEERWLALIFYFLSIPVIIVVLSQRISIFFQSISDIL